MKSVLGTIAENMKGVGFFANLFVADQMSNLEFEKKIPILKDWVILPVLKVLCGHKLIN